MDFLRFKLPRDRKSRLIFFASIFMGITVLTVFIFETFKSYRKEIYSAEIQATNLSHVLEEQILSSFKKIDLVLLDIQDSMVHELEVYHKGSDLKKFLKNHKNRLPELWTIKIFDKNGDLIDDDTDNPVEFNVKDRSYFKAFKDNPKNELFISEPVIGRASKIWVIILSRPILDKENKFAGVINAVVPVDYYHQMFTRINIGEKGSIALFGYDSSIYTRFPLTENIIGTRIDLTEHTRNFLKSAKSVHVYKDYSRVDGFEKIYSIRKISNFPLFIAIGLSTQEILNSWRTRTILYVVFLSAIFITFSVTLFIYIRSAEMLEEQRKLAVQSAKLTTLGEMASNIAHEINNPLTVISTLAMISKFPEATNDKEARLNNNIDKIIQTVDRIAKIIKSLRTFSRDSYDDPILPTSLQTIMNTTAELCVQRLKNNQVNVVIDPFEDRLIKCREFQIVQVLMNLLNNSLDALEGQNEKKVRVRVEEAGAYMRILVQDNGPKIPDDIVDKMMNPFYTTKEMGKGTGLGLSISKGIIENHKGYFYFDKNKSETTFVIELPKA